MEFLQLYYFNLVAKCEHMTSAAAQLHIAQPALTQTIRRLEQELGVPLFDHEGRRIRLNIPNKSFRQRTTPKQRLTMYVSRPSGQCLPPLWQPHRCCLKLWSSFIGNFR